MQRRSDRTAPSKGDQRERALLDAAEGVLASGEWPSVSVAALADQAGISRATFYFYFASKQALLGAVIARTVTGLEERLVDEHAAGAGSAADRVARTVRAAADLWREHRSVLLASVEVGSALPQVYERGMASIKEVTGLTMTILRMAGHSAATGEPEETERLVAALVLMSERNFYDLARRTDSPAEFDDLAGVLTTIWLRSLGLQSA